LTHPSGARWAPRRGDDLATTIEVLTDRRDGIRILVLYYSRTGHTRTVAKALAAALGARLLEIACRRYEGWTGPLAMAWDIFTRNRPAVTVPGLEDEDFDLTLVGGPVWAARPAPPVVSLLTTMGNRSALCLFLTCNGTSPQYPADDAMAELVAVSPGGVAATGIFKEATITSDALLAAVDDFARRIRQIAPTRVRTP
jgi:hypothetical protein